MELKIAVDVDGVLLDSYGHLMKTLDKKMRMLDQWSDEEINKDFKLITDIPKWWEDIPKLTSPSAIDFDFECYLTAIPKRLRFQRRMNLMTEGFPNKPVVPCFDKIDYCLKNGINVLIDDKEETIIQARNFGINGILVKPYYYSEKYGKDLNPIRSILEAKSQLYNKYE